MGYTNIKLYNGGIKDWKKNTFPLLSPNPIPEYDVEFIGTQQFYRLLKEVETQHCIDENGKSLITLLDLRNSNLITEETTPPQIKTDCRKLSLFLDDLLDEKVRKLITTADKVITITETGNRDIFAIRFLSQFGYTNIIGLQFGMRGWLKHHYPVEEKSPP